MVLEQFNLIHILSFTILPICLFFTLFFILRKKKENTKKNVLFGICCFNIVLYFIYKVYQAFYDRYDFELVYNLPLHFCNINLILLPLAIITCNKVLTAYQVYFGTFLSFFALVAIDPSFRGEPFFEFSCLVYYYYHSMLAVIPFILLTFKMFKPSFKIIWQPAVMLIFLMVLAHLINIIFRMTGIGENSNYFFTYGFDGGSSPYYFFILIPVMILVFTPYIMLITLPYHIFSLKQKK